MKVDHALILAAGKGTRMGPIGEKLPKVIWPVFEKSILELEVLYAKKLGAHQVHTNLYNHKEKVQAHIDNHSTFKSVNVIVEDSAIDIGGAIHNLANQLDYKGNLLILNSDQFIMFDQNVFDQAKQLLNTSDIVLFTYDVNSNQLYNKLIIDSENNLLGILENKNISRDIIHQTYTGMALVKLESLERSVGPSKFFSSVANPENKVVKCVNIAQSVYWDFGTIQRYHQSLFKLLSMMDSKDPFVEFLMDVRAIDQNKINGSSYYTKSLSAINLSSKDVELGENSILMSDNATHFVPQKNVIIFEDISLTVAQEDE